jgi:addiction module HigA family antidote
MTEECYHNLWSRPKDCSNGPEKRLDAIPPGEILLEEFMRPNGISQNRLALDIDVNPAQVNDIVHGRSAITAPLALWRAKYFGTTRAMDEPSGLLRIAPRPRDRLTQGLSAGCEGWRRNRREPGLQGEGAAMLFMERGPETIPLSE